MKKNDGSIWLVGLVCVVTITIGWTVQYQKTQSIEAVRKAFYSEKAAALGAAIESHLVEAVEVTMALRGLLRQTPNISQDQFEALARELRRGREHFLNIAYAPDMVVDYVFPMEGNESVLGFDVRTRSDQWSAIVAAAEMGGPVVSGPLPLIQGGNGFIVRVPLFNGEGFGLERMTGVISSVVSTLPISGLVTEAGGNEATVSIRKSEALSASGEIVFGPAHVFDKDPVLFDVQLPYGHWQVGIHPNEPWNKLTTGTLFRLWTAVIAMSVCSTLILLTALRFHNRKERAEDDLAAAIASIEDGFAMFDPDDKLIMCNAQYAELYSLPQHLQTPGTPFVEILRYGLDRGEYPEAEGREADWLQERLELHQNPTSSFNQLLSDGRWLKIAESKTRNGSIVGFRVDITELKNAQEAAERANKIKSQFLNNINHEMRTPLTVMLGYLPMLGDIRHMPSFANLSAGLDVADPELKSLLHALAQEVSDLTSRVQSSGKHLLHLVNDTLDLSKIEAGEMIMDVRPVALGSMVESLVKEFSPQCSAKGVALLPANTEFAVLADELRLRQILVNLIGNAVKFTQSGVIKVYAEQHHNQLEIIVSDTGCGIPSIHLSKVFDEFYQGDASTTRNFGGTGLGLSISRNLAELQGGSLRVASVEGAGSRFSIILPLATEGDKKYTGSKPGVDHDPNTRNVRNSPARSAAA